MGTEVKIEGSCEISDFELEDIKHANIGSIRQLMKEKGVPMKGNFYPRISEDYIIITKYCPNKKATKYEWYKKSKENECLSIRV